MSSPRVYDLASYVREFGDPPPNINLHFVEVDHPDRHLQYRREHTKDFMSSDSDSAAAAGLTPAASTPSTKESEEKKEEELVVVREEEIGMNAGLKNLYSGKEDKRGRFQWQTKIPEDLGKPAEDADSLKWAILVRNVKVYGDPRRVLALHSIVVQSPLLKELLSEVLAGYPGVTSGLNRLEFSGQFEPLIHRWAELTTAIEALRDEAAKSKDGTPSGKADTDKAQDSEPKEDDEKVHGNAEEHVKHAELLYNLLAEEFKDTIASSQDMMKKGVITYDLLWTGFQPGCFVYTKLQGQDRIFRLYSSQYGRDRNGNAVYWLTLQYVDYDGTRFGTNKLNLSIAQFEGTKNFSSLSALPLEQYAQKDALKGRLIERGTKIESFVGSHYRAYNGYAWRVNHMNQTEKYTVKGRIVLDTYGWNRFEPNHPVYVVPFHLKDSPLATGFGGGESRGLRGLGGDDVDEYDGGHQDDNDEDCGIPLDGFFVDEDEEEKRGITLTDQQKMMCSATVRGYALKEKMWLNFFVNAVQDISFNTRAFESLVLPENQKELILGFTATQQIYRNQFDDVIEGKGRGIILLLCGPPGVGKTLTAESVAEEMKAPLYMMSAGDLGLDPRHVESKLQGILDMCTRWNAILLLDEADVFLEERSLHELERNKLVSVFLRVLEYYEGIMFLTTNRVQTFDPAFQSRIHISIDYPELSTESRRTVWTNFLAQHDVAQAAALAKPPKSIAEDHKEAWELHKKRTLPHVISEQDVKKLSRMEMNGRQIKNILKTAQLLASKREQGLSFEHIDTVLSVTQHLHNTQQVTKKARDNIYS